MTPVNRAGHPFLPDLPPHSIMGVKPAPDKENALPAKAPRDKTSKARTVRLPRPHATAARPKMAPVGAQLTQLTAVLDMLPVYLVLLSPDYHVPFANRFFRERFGEAKGRRCFEYLFKRSEPCEVCETYKALKEMRPLEWNWTGPDGRNYHIFDYPIEDADGSTLIMEVGIDITEHMQAREELRQARDGLEQRVAERTHALAEAEATARKMADEWKTTFDSIADMVSIQDKDFRLLRVNKAFEDAVGIDAADLLGRTCHEVVHGAACPIDNCPYRQTLADGRSCTKEIFEPRLGVHLEVSTSPILDENGQVVASVHIAKDITDRQRMEEQLRQHATELEATNRELETFAYSVSHDLQAPLRSLDGFSEALLEDYNDALDATAKNYLQRIRGSSQTMGQLIDSLLRLSRVTRSELHRETVNLSEIAADIAAHLKSTQPDRPVDFVITPELIGAGDHHLLRQVFENLLGNAWKFTAGRNPAQIEFGTVDRDGRTVYFVRDNGVGFNMTYVNKLFQPFQRLHSSTEFPGTGIGLATVQRIIRRHGGEVWAEGEVDKGATFYFTLR